MEMIRQLFVIRMVSALYSFKLNAYVMSEMPDVVMHVVWLVVAANNVVYWVVTANIQFISVETIPNI